MDLLNVFKIAIVGIGMTFLMLVIFFVLIKVLVKIFKPENVKKGE
ncbi:MULTISPECIES: OadG-related small transporter subunit [Thermoanaerobacter]|jgi:Na+-transporting methylmalonyl-CoA/oxaloacetate decarboxylase gamma subunit|uniref:Oxaloacetate decarboxylase, gamma chain n=1 Tax=Thermoanaerobacter uzonensis DSM 18761 TaxID=1123369 RepID=A0A1M4SGU4_9THEO|nr:MULTISPECIES: OadG-related small transporter subunit [Thermoanaerobacter]SHE31416.1 hypothetical protein SAMN02745195_00142 [Thermoanaerobacter uzonensis DSM 18761]